MSRFALDVAALRVESFEAGAEPGVAQAGATYPDCPTATGCTCYEWCLSIVRICAETHLGQQNV